MRILITILALLAVPCVAMAEAKPGKPLSEAQCEAVWKKVGLAQLKPDQAKPFVKSFEQVDVDKNGAINWEEFKAGCKEGWIHA